MSFIFKLYDILYFFAIYMIQIISLYVGYMDFG